MKVVCKNNDYDNNIQYTIKYITEGYFNRLCINVLTFNNSVYLTMK